MTSISNHLQGPASWGVPRTEDAPKSDAPGAAAGLAETVLTALSDEQLRAIASGMHDMNAGLGSLVDQFGATAISLPQVESPADLGALSTADLLQLIRTEARKTTELLLVATTEVIKNMQAKIDLQSQTSIAKLMDAAKNQAEAQETQKKMGVVNWVLMGLGAVACVALVAAAVFTGGATLIAAAAISTAMFATMTCLTQIKDSDGVSPMDKGMENLGKSMSKLAEKYGDLPAVAKVAVLALETAALVAACVFAPNPSLIAGLATVLAMSVIASLPDKWCSDEMKGQLMAATLMVGVMIAVSAGAAQACSGVSSAATSSASAATRLGMAAERATELGARAAQIGKFTELTEALGNVAQSGLGIDVAAHQFQADSARATVTALKAMVAMLQKLVDGDAEFTQKLAEIQAMLDQGCAEVIAIEFATNEKESSEIHNYS